jgi:hypothetical protein
MFFLLFCSSIRAEVTSGIDTAYGSFDFSRSDSLSHPYDVSFSYVDPGGRSIDAMVNRIIDLGAVSYESIIMAPDTGYTTFIIDYNTAHVFCVKTIEGNYAKFKVIGKNSDGYEIIKWCYQNDGTRFLYNHSDINYIYQNTSWGTLKQNYR